jgi:hypothetical protein
MKEKLVKDFIKWLTEAYRDKHYKTYSHFHLILSKAKALGYKSKKDYSFSFFREAINKKREMRIPLELVLVIHLSPVSKKMSSLPRTVSAWKIKDDAPELYLLSEQQRALWIHGKKKFFLPDLELISYFASTFNNDVGYYDNTVMLFEK